MKSSLTYLLIVLSLFCVRGVSAQDAPLKIHPLVGDELDQEEIARYKIGNLLDIFWNKLTIVQIYLNGPDSLKVVSSSKYSGTIQSEYAVERDFISKIRKTILRIDKRLIEDITKLGTKLGNGDSIFVIAKTHYGYESGGRALKLENDTLFLDSDMEIALEDLAAIKISNGGSFDPYGKFNFNEPSNSRYFFGPNAIGMEKGELVYKNTLITISSMYYGISNNISVGAGIESASLIFNFLDGIGEDKFQNFQTYVYSEAKISKELQPGVHLAGGVIYGGGLGPRAVMGAFGMAYIANTFGNKDLNVSTRLFIPLNFAANNSSSSTFQGSTAIETIDRSFNFPPLSLSFLKRMTPNLYLVTENFYYSLSDDRILQDEFGIITNEKSNSQNYLVSIGARIVNKRTSWELGMMVWGQGTVTRNEIITSRSSTAIPIPFFSMNYRLR
ncbi:MAG: hypothetical protein MRZ79_23165 [Bacteroidia bacterium]|nr:hypothetical protein [Bacteroidia bacterium]